VQRFQVVIAEVGHVSLSDWSARRHLAAARS
jgi:hypothetical protein